ncbi:MAG: type II toxin-antitoxin system RelE family toxin [Phycisphaerae bacterium]
MALVKITPGAAKGLEDLPNVIHRRVMAVMAQLERWPEISGAKPLSGKLAGHYRKRTGDYRVQFRVDGDMGVIERVGHRDGFYED